MKKPLILICAIVFSLNVGHAQQQPNPIFNAFKQGYVKEGGNCSSIAVIKAAIGTFGIGKVFQEDRASRTNDNFTYILKNGDKVTLNHREIQEATERAKFIQKDSTLEAIAIKCFADTCYAVMCKHLMTIDTSIKTYSAAITRLNSGYKTAEIGTVLGIKLVRIETTCQCNLSDYENIIIYNIKHAAYASRGEYDESGAKTGKKLTKNLRWQRMGFKCGFFFCGIRGAFRIVG